MNQKQPQRSSDQDQQKQPQNVQPVKYGNVFPVSGELASKPIAPKDAAMMQTAENSVFGQTQKGGPAARMQAAATVNERAGIVAHDDASDAAAHQGVSVTDTELPGARVVTESVGGQVCHLKPSYIYGVMECL